MDYVRLGSTGLKVSKLALGCMSFGDPEKGNHRWTLDEEAARPLVRKAIERGVNFFDTANVYSAGSSELIVGKILKELMKRDDIILATKVHGRMGSGPNAAGLSRKSIMLEIDNSLRRLGTDYIDLYQTHFWDHETPIEETLEALNDLVKAGKVRYLGACNMYAWQFAKAIQISEKNGWATFKSMQLQLNLIYREEEREMLPFCRSEGIGIMPFSPLARGILTRNGPLQSERSESDNVTGRFYDATCSSDQLVVAEIAKIAGERGVSRAQIALAWVQQKPGITSPIVGATKLDHLNDAFAALDITLSEEEIGRLEAPYTPHPVVGLL